MAIHLPKNGETTGTWGHYYVGPVLPEGTYVGGLISRRNIKAVFDELEWKP
jgi:hypothetical protein